MAPRTVRVPGYTGWCLACLEAALASTSGRSRTPPGASRGTRRTAIPLCNKPSSLSRHYGFPRAFHLRPRRGRGQYVTGVLSRAGGSKGSRAAVARWCRMRALSAARREPTELSDEAEGGPLSHETERVSGGYSQPHAPCARFTSRTCSNRPLVARSDAVRPHHTPAFAELLTRRPDLEDGHEQG